MLAIKILLFLLVNIAGFFANAFIISLASAIGFFPEMPTQNSLNTLNDFLYFWSFWVWLGAALGSAGYFIVEKNRGWFILAPLYFPSLYTLAVILYFKYAPVAL